VGGASHRWRGALCFRSTYKDKRKVILTLKLFIRYIWRKKKIILLNLLIVYIGSFLLLPVDIAVNFKEGIILNEKDAADLLPIIHWSIELKEYKLEISQNEQLRLFTAHTLTINGIAILYYLKLYFMKHYSDKEINIDGVAWRNTHWYDLDSSLYSPLWWLLLSKLIPRF